jgi:hypothetical protein
LQDSSLLFLAGYTFCCQAGDLQVDFSRWRLQCDELSIEDFVCWRAEEDGFEEANNGGATGGGGNNSSGGRRHLSAKERKLIKKVPCQLLPLALDYSVTSSC